MIKKSLKHHIRDSVISIFGSNFYYRVVGYIRKFKRKLISTISFSLIKFKVLNKISSYVLGNKVKLEDFENFEGYKNNRQRIIDAGVIRDIFFDNPTGREIFTEEFIKYSREIDRKDYIPPFYEYLIMIGQSSNENTAKLVSIYIELIEDAQENNDTITYEYYVSKLGKYDRVSQKYFQLLSTESSISKNESSFKWKNLLDEAEKSKSIVLEKIRSNYQSISE